METPFSITSFQKHQVSPPFLSQCLILWSLKTPFLVNAGATLSPPLKHHPHKVGRLGFMCNPVLGDSQVQIKQKSMGRKRKKERMERSTEGKRRQVKVKKREGKKKRKQEIGEAKEGKGQ